MLRLAYLFALTVVAAGCYPVTRLQTPRTTPPGRVHGALGGTVTVNKLDVDDNLLGHVGPDVWLGLGVSDRVELSVRARPVAMEVGAKVQLVRDAVEVSIAPAVIAADENVIFDEYQDASTNVSVLASRTTLYVGSDADEPFSVWIAPTIDMGERAHDTWDGQVHELLVAPGVLAGLVIHDGHSMRALLEFGVLVPSTGDPEEGIIYEDDVHLGAHARLGPGDVRLQLGLGVRFGSFELDD